MAVAIGGQAKYNALMQLKFLRLLIGAEKPKRAVSETYNNGFTNVQRAGYWDAEGEPGATLFKRGRL
jgi:hypothetical protein